MGRLLFLFIIVLLVVAVFLQEDFVFSLVYLLLGTYILGRWWGKRALDALSVQRSAPQRMFLGEQAKVHLEIANQGWLPLVWLQLHESVPVELASRGTLQQVASIGPKGSMHVEYWLNGRRRGWYPIGPLTLFSGDAFGVINQSRRSCAPDYVTVYPQIIPLVNVPLASRMPVGSLAHVQPIYEDPSRINGKRDYVSGDSLRRVDWKTSAQLGRLLVKKYEPSISLETGIYLNLNAAEYDPKRRFDQSELAIVIAASLANWIISHRQAVGLVTNAVDSRSGELLKFAVPPRRGRGHLMRLLEMLARLESAESYPLEQLLRMQRVRLPWGATQVLVTPSLNDAAFDALFQARQSGLNTMILLVGSPAGYLEIQQRARYFGFPFYAFETVKDLDIWRR